MFMWLCLCVFFLRECVYVCEFESVFYVCFLQCDCVCVWVHACVCLGCTPIAHPIALTFPLEC